jgi:hypothetical protein
LGLPRSRTPTNDMSPSRPKISVISRRDLLTTLARPTWPSSICSSEWGRRRALRRHRSLSRGCCHRSHGSFRFRERRRCIGWRRTLGR